MAWSKIKEDLRKRYIKAAEDNVKLLKQYLENEENKKIYNDAIQKVIKTVQLYNKKKGKQNVQNLIKQHQEKIKNSPDNAEIMTQKIKNDIATDIKEKAKIAYEAVEILQELTFKIFNPKRNDSIRTIFGVSQGKNKQESLEMPPVFYDITGAEILNTQYSFTKGKATTKYGTQSLSNEKIVTEMLIPQDNNIENSLQKIKEHQKKVKEVYKNTAKYNKSKQDNQQIIIYLPKLHQRFLILNLGDYYEGYARWMFDYKLLGKLDEISNEEQQISLFLHEGALTVTSKHGFLEPDIFNEVIAYSLKKEKAQTMGIQYIYQYAKQVQKLIENPNIQTNTLSEFIAKHFLAEPKTRNFSEKVQENLDIIVEQAVKQIIQT